MAGVDVEAGGGGAGLTGTFTREDPRRRLRVAHAGSTPACEFRQGGVRPVVFRPTRVTRMQQKVGRWLIEYDREATRRCFARLPAGAPCDCVECRNFNAAAGRIFPPEFLALADELGVDVTKPAELCHCVREDSGLYLVGGWFHFVGSLISGEDLIRWNGRSGTYRFEQLVPGCEFGFRADAVLVPAVFNGRRVVQLEFVTRVPWSLSDPEPY